MDRFQVNNRKQNRPDLKQRIRKKTILKIIRENAPVSATEISRLSGFTIPTTLNILRQLLKDEFIEITREAVNHVGRPPALYHLKGNSYFVVGVDLGRSYTTMLLLDTRDEVKATRSLATRECHNADSFLAFVVRHVRQLIAESGVNPERILGLGVALPGPIHYTEGRAWRFCGIENYPIQEKLSYEFNLPVFVENDARAMALGEKWYGKARNVRNAVCLNLGWGIGMGLILNGDVYRGSFDFAGEFGHMVVEENGPPCQCGGRGCLESLASGTAISRQVRERIAQGAESAFLKGRFGNCLEELQAKDVARAAREGDRLAQEVFARAGDYLGRGLATVVNLLNPEKIILGGRLALAGDLLLQPMRESLQRFALPFSLRKVEIELSDLIGTSGAMGAASLVKKEIYEVSHLDLSGFV